MILGELNTDDGVFQPTMEDEGLVMEDEFHTCHSEPADSETEPLLRPTQSTYETFRLERETQQSSRWILFILAAFKVCFCSLGCWGHRAWNNIPRVLLVIVCVYYSIYMAYCGPLQPCKFMYGNLTDAKKKIPCVGFKIGYITTAIAAMASILSCLVFIGCYVRANKRKESALVSPSQSMIKDINKGSMFSLFLPFLITNVLLASSVVLCYQINILLRSTLADKEGRKWTNVTTLQAPDRQIWAHSNQLHLADSLLVNMARNPPPAEGAFCDAFWWIGDATQFFIHWASVNMCHIFAASCLALGTFAQDSLRLIRKVQTGTLDDVIKIHEDLCTVVFGTVSVYSVWFVTHWFTHGAAVILLVIKFVVELQLLFESDKFHTDTQNVVFASLLLAFFIFLFLFPCVYAASITSHCTGIYEKINCTTSDDWNEGHLFKDRRNIALFISYAEKRRCGFKIGRITFDTSLAWLSFLFGLIALLFPLIQHGYSIYT